MFFPLYIAPVKMTVVAFILNLVQMLRPHTCPPEVNLVVIMIMLSLVQTNQRRHLRSSISFCALFRSSKTLMANQNFGEDIEGGKSAHLSSPHLLLKYTISLVFIYRQTGSFVHCSETRCLLGRCCDFGVCGSQWSSGWGWMLGSCVMIGGSVYRPHPLLLSVILKRMQTVKHFLVHGRDILSGLYSVVWKPDSGKQEGPVPGGQDSPEDCRSCTERPDCLQRRIRFISTPHATHLGLPDCSPTFSEEVLHFKNLDHQVWGTGFGIVPKIWIIQPKKCTLYSSCSYSLIYSVLFSIISLLVISLLTLYTVCVRVFVFNILFF